MKRLCLREFWTFVYWYLCQTRTECLFIYAEACLRKSVAVGNCWTCRLFRAKKQVVHCMNHGNLSNYKFNWASCFKLHEIFIKVLLILLWRVTLTATRKYSRRRLQCEYWCMFSCHLLSPHLACFDFKMKLKMLRAYWTLALLEFVSLYPLLISHMWWFWKCLDVEGQVVLMFLQGYYEVLKNNTCIACFSDHEIMHIHAFVLLNTFCVSSSWQRHTRSLAVLTCCILKLNINCCLS